MIQAKPCLIAPNPQEKGLTRQVAGLDHLGADVALNVVEERPLTIWLNGQEIVTAMTIGDYPEYLAQGFLSNQGMLAKEEIVEAVDFDAELETVVVRTNQPTNYEAKLKKKTRTSGCAVGTVFGDIMEGIEGCACLRRCFEPPGFTACRARSTKCRASISVRVRSTARCFARAMCPWSIWKTWGAIMRWIRWPGGCARRKPRVPTKFSIPLGV
jgi:hypothetical protein